MEKHQEKYMTYSEAFNYYIDLIQSGKPFALSRYCDGEAAILMGTGVGRGSQAWEVDRWEASPGESLFQDELWHCLHHDEPDFHYALPTLNDPINKEGVHFLLDNCPSKNITYNTVFSNANYKRWKEYLQTKHRKRTVVIANQDSPMPFPCTSYEFPDNCVNAYNEDPSMYSKYEDLARGYLDTTFFISAGPAACILVSKMWRVNPTNQYIDVGSALDEFVHKKKTRPYMNPNSGYATLESYR